MSQDFLRDKSGKLIGTINTEFNGKLVARDTGGIRLGEYDAKSNATRNPGGVRIGTGNQLSGLFTRK